MFHVIKCVYLEPSPEAKSAAKRFYLINWVGEGITVRNLGLLTGESVTFKNCGLSNVNYLLTSCSTDIFG